GHPDRGQLLEHLQVDLVADRAAAPLLRVRKAEQPAPAEQPELLAREPARRLVLARDRLELADGDLAGEVKEILGVRVGQQPLYRHVHSRLIQGSAIRIARSMFRVPRSKGG